jgi:hypothetical protein
LVSQQLRIESLGPLLYQEKEQGFLFPGEAYGMTELTYVDRGSVHSVADGQDILLEQGDLVLYRPDQWHMQYADIGVAPRLVTISFLASGCDWEKIANQKITAGQKMRNLLQQMLQEQERGGQYNMDMIISLHLNVPSNPSGNYNEKTRGDATKYLRKMRCPKPI